MTIRIIGIKPGIKTPNDLEIELYCGSTFCEYSMLSVKCGRLQIIEQIAL